MKRVAGLQYDVLDELLGYALRRAQLAMFGAFGQATRGVGITPPRFTALVIVGANPGISQSALGEVLGIARSGAMLLTDWAQERGLVERRHRPDDGRAWGLHLTRAGEQFVQKMKRRVLEQDMKASSCRAPGERRELMRLLDKLASPISQEEVACRHVADSSVPPRSAWSAARCPFTSRAQGIDTARIIVGFPPGGTTDVMGAQGGGQAARRRTRAS